MGDMYVDNGGLDTNNGTAGGGELLDYMGSGQEDNPFINDQVIKEFLAMPWVKGIIAAMFVILAILIIMRLFKIRNPMRKKTISKELDHIANVKKHDESVIKANRLIKAITNVIEASPLSLDKSNIDYWKYNLTRANIRIPGKSRVMKPEEFNAIIKLVVLAISLIAIIVGLATTMVLSIIIIIAAFILGSTLPMTFLRAKVKAKDSEVIENFADFYLMLHYVLLASASTPIAGIMKSYDKTTESEEMHRLVDTCIHYIDTYGEFEATSHIAKQYREIAEVGKLMRLIRQANEGGDVRAELVGFRDELLSAKKYAIEKRMNKLVAKARASFALLYIVLVQAIISAMAIYFDDLGMMNAIL